MIQISPHIEPPLYEVVASSQAGPDESSYVSGPSGEEERGEDREDFAAILAGLLQNGGTGETETAVDEELTVSLTDAADAAFGTAFEDISFIEDSGNEDSGKNTAAGFGQKLGIEKTQVPDVSKKTEKIAVTPNEIEAELSRIDFSEEDQNILLGVELLLNRSAETVSLAKDEEGLSAKVRIDPEHSGLEQLDAALSKTVVLRAEETAEEVQQAGEALGKGLKKTGKEKNRDSSAEVGQNGKELAAADKKAEELSGQAALAKKGAEKEGRGKLDETRNSRRRDRVSLEVRDLRTGNAQAAENAAKTSEMRVLANAEQARSGDSREITLELRLPNQGQNNHAAQTSWETKAGTAFENILARELHQNFNNDIVRHASAVLRDEGSGTIRLALKPESLGNVKIRLEMAENRITGHIVVESEEALRAFEREVRSLEQAFKESGFQSANLEMSLASDGRGADQFQQEAGPFLSREPAASRYDAALEQAPLLATVDLYQRGPASVNMLA